MTAGLPPSWSSGRRPFVCLLRVSTRVTVWTLAQEVPHYRIALEKSLPRGRYFTGKNSPRPAAAGAGRIFTGKLSAGGRLFRVERERSYNRKTYLGGRKWRYFNKKKHINTVIISPWADFSWGRHFNVTPALRYAVRCCCCSCVARLRDSKKVKGRHLSLLAFVDAAHDASGTPTQRALWDELSFVTVYDKLDTGRKVA